LNVGGFAPAGWSLDDTAGAFDDRSADKVPGRRRMRARRAGCGGTGRPYR
jgi:hypothetical protein